MTAKRFIFEQNGNFHTVVDTVENKPMGVFEFKEDEFPVYACFHMIIDKMNELYEENQELKQLKHRLAISEKANFVTALEKENEQLKNICKNLINEINKRGITVTMSDEYKELLE